LITASSRRRRLREALQRAARIAHLDVLEIVAEPIAGALAIGVHAELAERRLMVCDFGGGTFDVSALVQSGLRFTRSRPVAISTSVADDLDTEIAEALAGLISKRTGYDVHRDAVRWSEMVFRCEMAKRPAHGRGTVAVRDARRLRRDATPTTSIRARARVGRAAVGAAVRARGHRDLGRAAPRRRGAPSRSTRSR